MVGRNLMPRVTALLGRRRQEDRLAARSTEKRTVHGRGIIQNGSIISPNLRGL